ncbi:MAG: ISAs1 family transposase [Hydrogenophaga sp.]|nr:ISAs1 family transposase [Luteolibacter sp.]MDZ4126287.1 ISAs1 family transposase [Hydrogenophaga sp.]
MIITAAGGDHFHALKDNQPTLCQLAREKLDGRPADWTSDTECEHGRIEWRELRVVSFDLGTALFPGARQLASLTRWYREKKSSADFKSETRYFITSLSEGEAGHARLAEIARGHWSVENKNHWKKDATLWREDRGVRRKAKGARNLALLRNAILALIRPEEHASLNHAFLHYADHRPDAIRLLTQTQPYNA